MQGDGAANRSGAAGGGKVGVDSAPTYTAAHSPATTPGLGDMFGNVRGGGKVCTKCHMVPRSFADAEQDVRAAWVPAPTRRGWSVGGTPVWLGPASQTVCSRDGQRGWSPPRTSGNCRPRETETRGSATSPLDCEGSGTGLRSPACSVWPLWHGKTHPVQPLWHISKKRGANAAHMGSSPRPRALGSSGLSKSGQSGAWPACSVSTLDCTTLFQTMGGAARAS